MLFNIMKKKENEEYCYIGENRTEVSEQFLAVKLSENDAKKYAKVLNKDGGSYVLIEAKAQNHYTNRIEFWTRSWKNDNK